MSNLNILIVGASIAGPMAAYWLAKSGARVTVIERYPSLRTGGQNIDIRLTGVTVMRRIPGMEDAVRSALAPLEGLSFVRDDGTPIGVMKGTGDPDQQTIMSEFEIFRGELSRILFELSNKYDNVEYIFDEQIASIQQHNNGPARVEFTNGTPSSEYDLIVACDGATSRTRAMAFNCGVRDHIVPTGAWAAFFSSKSDLLQGGKIGQAFSAPGGRCLAIGPDSTTSNRIISMNTYPTANDPDLEKFRHAQKQGTDEQKQFLAQRYQGVGWKTNEIIAALLESDDLYASEICQVKIPTLYTNRIVLVGDSGYAAGPTGTGTSLAMAGAYVLAGEISRHQDIAAGLKAYQDRMQPIIKDMHVIPPGALSFMAPQTEWGITFRNAVFVLVCWAIRFGSMFGWLASFWGAATGKDKYGIPEYEF